MTVLQFPQHRARSLPPPREMQIAETLAPDGSILFCLDATDPTDQSVLTLGYFRERNSAERVLAEWRGREVRQ